MEENVSNNRIKANYWKISVFIILFLWTASIIGLVYFFRFSASFETKISQAEKIPFSSPIPSPSSVSPTLSLPLATPASLVKQNVQLPVIVYEPSGLFSVDDKQDLTNKIVNPFFDYNNETEINFIAMIIDKNQSGEYGFLAIHKNGGYNSQVVTKQGSKFDYWYPECMEVCQFSESYKQKYPEVVTLATQNL